jgi:hypothetical protein
MKRIREWFSTPRGAITAWICTGVMFTALLFFLVTGVGRTWNVANDLRAERVESCIRGNIARHEITQVSQTLRHLVLLSIRNAPPVASMTYQQRVTYEGFKEEATRLTLAIKRLAPVPCEKE